MGMLGSLFVRTLGDVARVAIRQGAFGTDQEDDAGDAGDAPPPPRRRKKKPCTPCQAKGKVIQGLMAADHYKKKVQARKAKIRTAFTSPAGDE